ncbi:MAG: hypothetical protein SA339_12170 [Methanomassiliicoccus sp.]|nr:hypothetical protein [Methanomassiliicoccus sp.]
MDIQTERVLIAVMDALFDDVEDCPKKRQGYQIIENIRHANNQEIMEQIGAIAKEPCDPNCLHRKRKG